MKKLFTILILLLSTNLIQAQGFIKIDTIQNPTEINSFFPGQDFETFHVDFNGDGTKDYICRPNAKTEDVDPHNEIWIDSDYNKVTSIEKYQMHYNFFWFVNIDSDPEPEIFSSR